MPADRDYKALGQFFAYEAGCKYDWLGVLLGWAGVESKARWFCSEFCWAALHAYGITPSVCKLCTPEQLYQALRRNGVLQGVA